MPTLVSGVLPTASAVMTSSAASTVISATPPASVVARLYVI